jgi:hypothetical protein
MKNPMLIMTGVVLAGLISSVNVAAQQQEKNSRFNVSADLYSNYLWRGSRFGTGPHIQPAVEFIAGGLTLGVWGSFDFHGYSEADPYVTYSFPFGLSLGLTDYYYPGTSFFDASVDQGSHAFEVNGSYSTGGLTLSANYILNESGGAGSAGGDLYFQAGYSFNSFEIFAGAGNGWHTSDGEFMVCNLGIGTARTIEVTDKFSIPVSGQIVLNPDTEQLFMTVGFSF